MAEWKKGGKGGFGGGKRGGFGKPSFGGGKSFGAKRGFGRKDGEEREMFDAVCSNCGNDCQVPFKPNGKTPILCKACFAKSKGDEEGGGRQFGGERRSFGAGKREPGSFEKRNEFGTRTSFKGERAHVQSSASDPRVGELVNGLAEVNQKLDRLLNLLSGVTLGSAVRKTSKKEKGAAEEGF